MESLKKMQECLIGVAESQVYGNIEKVNAEELGEVMDMIKDLSEAVYYTTITEAMHKQEYDDMMYSSPYYPMERYEPMPMYAQGRGMGSGSGRGSSKGYSDGMIRRYDDGQMSYSMYRDPMGYGYRGMSGHDPRGSRSEELRKMYMEGKGHKDKIKQMQELDSYMQELAQEVTEMIQDASAEEKSLLQQKLNTLAAKVK